jgi:DNA-binding beta-propeller fold protein YncE
MVRLSKAGVLVLVGSAALALSPANARGAEYETNVLLRGLSRPTGIAVNGSGTIYFTQIPMPGMGGGMNSVGSYRLGSKELTILHQGEPEPTHIAVGEDGTLYWTCKSAGVILEQDEDGFTSAFLTGLQQPSGISVDRRENVYFTQIPTPGVPGTMGGMNTVNVSDGTTIEVLTMGEPEPTDIVVGKDGEAYWTCKSAGVILERDTNGVVSVLLRGLNKPVGIALDHKGENLYFTEVPTPGVSGLMGGSNRVIEYNLHSGEKTVVDFGDPEPTDIAVTPNGNLYWTCSSAGVIVEATPVKQK